MSLFDKSKKKKANIQQFIGAASIEDCCLITFSGERIAFIMLSPCNLSVLPPEVIQSLIMNLKGAINGLGTAEYLCINSSQNYDSNKKHLAKLANLERNETLKELDMQDIQFLDDIRIKMATNREFYIVLRFYSKVPLEQVSRQLIKAEQLMKENHFIVQLAESKALKRLFAIYYEQNLFDEALQDFDGELYAENMLEGSL